MFGSHKHVIAWLKECDMKLETTQEVTKKMGISSNKDLCHLEDNEFVEPVVLSM